MVEYIVRFFVGGLVVSAFALLSDLLRPKGFAGLFGAAPSVALATLALTIFTDGTEYAAIESRTMMWGAIALCLYSVFVCQLLMRTRIRALSATLLALGLWLLVALALQVLMPGGA